MPPMDAQEQFDQETRAGKLGKVDRVKLEALLEKNELASSADQSSTGSEQPPVPDESLIARVMKSHPGITRESIIEDLEAFGGL